MYDWEQQAQYYCDLADERLEMLKRIDKYAKKTGKCLFCRMWGNEKTDNWQHAPDCELAEAIAEE